MTQRTPPDRIATAGRCHCGTKVVRGPDQHAALATAEVWPADAATELLAHTQGRPSYVMALAHPSGLTLTRRTPTDLARTPAGYTRDRIVLAHRCP